MSDELQMPPVVGRWMVALRLFTYLLVTGSVIITLGAPAYMLAPVLLYSALTLYWPTATVWKRIRLSESLHRFFILCQLIIELFIEVAIVNSTGAALSPFTGLFYLTIISGALTFNLVGALGLASLAAFGHLIVNWYGYTLGELIHIDGGFWSALKKAPDEAFFAGFLSALSFYTTAFVAGYFSERLRNKDKELANASVALSRVRMQTDEIVRRLSAGLLTIDGAGRIILFNDFAETIFGIPEVSIRGMDFRDAFKGGFAEFGRELEVAFDSGVSRPRMEATLVRADGVTLPLGLSTAILGSESDDAPHLIAIFQDITEAKAMAEKARQSDKLMAVAELSAAMAHEIRNPLAAIAGSAQMLSSELQIGAEEKKLFDLILKESARLNDLLGDFLSYARAKPVSLTKVELCHIAIEALEMMRRHPSFSSDVALTFESDAQVMYVIGTERQIQQIIFNLLLNAFEALNGYQSDEKRIALRVRFDAETSKIVLSVKDNGPGIPAGHVKDIFTPFYSTKQTGTGLGLSIVHRLAGSMFAEIDLDTIEDVGTTVHLRFKPYQDGFQPPSGSVKVESPQAYLSGDAESTTPNLQLHQ